MAEPEITLEDAIVRHRKVVDGILCIDYVRDSDSTVKADTIGTLSSIIFSAENIERLEVIAYHQELLSRAKYTLQMASSRLDRALEQYIDAVSKQDMSSVVFAGRFAWHALGHHILSKCWHRFLMSEPDVAHYCYHTVREVYVSLYSLSSITLRLCDFSSLMDVRSIKRRNHCEHYWRKRQQQLYRECPLSLTEKSSDEGPMARVHRIHMECVFEATEGILELQRTASEARPRLGIPCTHS